jgi:hypothetical protein
MILQSCILVAALLLQPVFINASPSASDAGATIINVGDDMSTLKARVLDQLCWPSSGALPGIVAQAKAFSASMLPNGNLQLKRVALRRS